MKTKNLAIRSHVGFAVFMEDGGMLHSTEWPGGWKPQIGDIVPVYVKNVDKRGRVDYGTTLPPQWPDGTRKRCVYSITWVGRKSAPDIYEKQEVEFVFRAAPGVWMKVLDGKEYPFSTEEPIDRHSNANDWDRGRIANYLFGRIR